MEADRGEHLDLVRLTGLSLHKRKRMGLDNRFDLPFSVLNILEEFFPRRLNFHLYFLDRLNLTT